MVMSKNIKPETIKMNILALILFFIPSFIFIIIQIKLSPFVYIKKDFSIILTIILVPLIHEFLHFVGFIIFGKLKPNQLIFKSNESSPLPYFRTNIPLNKNDYILVLLLPCMILICISICLALIYGNILFSVIIGYSLSMSAGDISLAIILLKLNTTNKIVPFTDELGFTIFNDTHEVF